MRKVRKLKTQTSNALAYSCNYLSFLLKIKEAATRIRAIYLFGSAVRGELERRSDIDLFVDCRPEHEAQVKRWVDSAAVQFTGSQDYEKWKLLRFTYPLSVHVGELKEWDLRLSIASEGMVLYAAESVLPGGQRMALFSITYPASKRAYIRVRRLLFGRSEEEYKHTGIVHKVGGKQIGSSVFLVPQHEQVRMSEILSGEKVIFMMKEMVVLES